ncbi:hypothetical protein Cpa01nite_16050 [Cellulomonas pakistanensis]|uniref:Uncharacterized protein n=2 Tax=Cellulomonas pakistanensis TaxID=992287 RepID=A0A919P8B5_9CELL|nr:hypothetical protein Cpa01nite_16050 [Cellulomonas pakistanensis]
MLTGTRLLTSRIVFVGFLGAIAIGALVAFVLHPSWQTAVSALCLIGSAALLWVVLGRWLLSGAQGVSLQERAVVLGYMVAMLVLFSFGAWTFSLASM